MLVMLQFVLLADGKPPEYARFALLPDTFLVVGAFAAIALLRGPRPRATLAITLALLTLPFGLMYVRAFVRDSGDATSRLAAARQIRDLGVTTIHVVAEPAPYSMPPVDLFRHRLILTAAAAESAGADLLVTADPARSATPISWADVPFTVVRPRPQIEQTLINLPESQRSQTRPTTATTVSSP
jgi:hypothetical protein